jgi:hypothetical protein
LTKANTGNEQKAKYIAGIMNYLTLKVGGPAAIPLCKGRPEKTHTLLVTETLINNCSEFWYRMMSASTALDCKHQIN